MIFNDIIIITIFSYFIGSIPFGVIFCKLLGYGDIRKRGSGNIGSTNALRVGGMKLGLVTFMFDFLKGILPVYLLQYLNYIEELVALGGIIAVFGHVFPVWLYFRGGKGVATTVGVLFVTVPSIALIYIFLWIVIFFTVRIVSIASLLSSLVAAIISFWYSIPYTIMITVLCLLIFYRHEENVVRIVKGRELSFKK